MKRIAVLLILLAIPPSASAAASIPTPTVAPPGNSGVNQYVESIPTGGGQRPTDTISPGGGSRSGSGGGSGSGSLGSGSGRSGSLAPSTKLALARQGRDGLGAAALARSTAPGAPGGAQQRGASAGNAPLTHFMPRTASAPSSALTSFLRALTGSTSSGGLGPLLPAILILSAVGAGIIALGRRRGT